MGKHASGKTTFALAGWIYAFIALVVIILLGAAVMLFAFSQTQQNDSAQAQDCQRGPAQLRIVSDPAALPLVEDYVKKYNATNPVVKDHCVKASVLTQSTSAALATLNSPAGPLPAAWVPVGADSISRLSGKGATPAADTLPLVGRSPLGVASQDTKLTTWNGDVIYPAQPRSRWSALSAASAYVAAHPDALAQPHPQPQTSPIAEDNEHQPSPRPEETGPVNPDVARDVAEMIKGNADEALASKTQPVAVSEAVSKAHDLPFVSFDENQVDFPLVTFTASDRVEEVSARAAEDFGKFVKDQSAPTISIEATKLVADSGAAPVIRYTAAESGISPEVASLADAATQLIPAEPADAEAWKRALDAERASAGAADTHGSANGPAAGSNDKKQKSESESAPTSSHKAESSAAPKPDSAQAEKEKNAPHPAPRIDPRPAPSSVLVLVDSSEAMGSELPAVRQRLNGEFTTAGQRGAVTSLWSFGAAAGTSLPYRDRVDLTIGDHGTRSSSMLENLAPYGMRQLNQSLTAAYLNSVLSGPTPARVVLITNGQDTSEFTTASMWTQVQLLHNRKPVAVDVIAIGGGVSADALRPVADRTGGRYLPVPAADSPEFAAALTAALQG